MDGNLFASLLIGSMLAAPKPTKSSKNKSKVTVGNIMDLVSGNTLTLQHFEPVGLLKIATTELVFLEKVIKYTEGLIDISVDDTDNYSPDNDKDEETDPDDPNNFPYVMDVLNLNKKYVTYLKGQYSSIDSSQIDLVEQAFHPKTKTYVLLQLLTATFTRDFCKILIEVLKNVTTHDFDTDENLIAMIAAVTTDYKSQTDEKIKSIQATKDRRISADTKIIEKTFLSDCNHARLKTNSPRFMATTEVCFSGEEIEIQRLTEAKELKVQSIIDFYEKEMENDIVSLRSKMENHLSNIQTNSKTTYMLEFTKNELQKVISYNQVNTMIGKIIKQANLPDGTIVLMCTVMSSITHDSFSHLYKK
jgi:hypothetical protein